MPSSKKNPATKAALVLGQELARAMDHADGDAAHRALTSICSLGLASEFLPSLFEKTFCWAARFGARPILLTLLDAFGSAQDQGPFAATMRSPSELGFGAAPKLDLAQALCLASNHGQVDCVEALLPKCSQSSVRWALEGAAQHGRLDSLTLLLAACPADFDAAMPLAWAAAAGHDECVKLLISRADSKAGRSEALRSAARHGQLQTVRLLLPVSDPNALGTDGLDAAAVARKEGHRKLAQFIDAFAVAQTLDFCTLKSAPSKARPCL